MTLYTIHIEFSDQDSLDYSNDSNLFITYQSSNTLTFKGRRIDYNPDDFIIIWR